MVGCNINLGKMILAVSLLLFFVPGSSNAYIDPGTSSVAFSVLGYFFSIALLGISFFIRPFRSLIRSMLTRLIGKGKVSEDKPRIDAERNSHDV